MSAHYSVSAMLSSIRTLLPGFRPLLLAPLLLGSCASIMTGSTSSIQVTSTPVGATIVTSTGLKATTPCSLELPNGTDVTINAQHEERPGDVRAEVSVPDLSRWTAGNLIMIGGTAGMISDKANPKAYVHKQDVHFDFSCSAEEVEAAKAAEAERRRRLRESSGGTLR